MPRRSLPRQPARRLSALSPGAPRRPNNAIRFTRLRGRRTERTPRTVSTTPQLEQPSTGIREIAIAHSPDSDDAFMFYGLATNKVRVPGLKFTHTLTDIETLNQKAIHEAFYDVTAISFHAYPYLQDNYALMACGGSVGEGYGPMIVASKRFTLDEIKHVRIAIPGELTTAALSLKLFAPNVQTTLVPFDQIIP